MVQYHTTGGSLSHGHVSTFNICFPIAVPFANGHPPSNGPMVARGQALQRRRPPRAVGVTAGYQKTTLSDDDDRGHWHSGRQGSVRGGWMTRSGDGWVGRVGLKRALCCARDCRPHYYYNCYYCSCYHLITTTNANQLSSTAAGGRCTRPADRQPATDKHFINDQTQLVVAALRAATYANPSLSLDEANRVVYCTAPDPHRVAVVSGGGAGHEPSFASCLPLPRPLPRTTAHSGNRYVGDGMLRAAVTGTVFASPSAKQISSCLSRCGAGSAGVLLVVMNYTGDVLHFGLATEKARAMGVAASAVEMVVVGEDVGVGRARSGRVGRRGMAGTVLVHKAAGALAATGATLAQCAALARLVAANLVTLGASLAHVHLPGSAALGDDSDGGGSDGDVLGPDEMELGMGIHNERGCRRMPVPRDVGELVDAMLRQLLDAGDTDRNYLGGGTGRGLEVVLLVNNLGGLSPLELGGITAEVVERLCMSHRSLHRRTVWLAS